MKTIEVVASIISKGDVTFAIPQGYDEWSPMKSKATFKAAALRIQ